MDRLECPSCKKKSIIEDFNLQYHKLGRQGVCKHCGKNVFLSVPARGIVKDKNGVAHKRFRNS